MTNFFDLQCHGDYSLALDVHGNQKSPMSSANLLESHNNYVQQLHATNGMIDQYYADALPDLLQVSIVSNMAYIPNVSNMLICLACLS